MGLALAADPVTAAATPGLGFSKFASSNQLSLADSPVDQFSTASSVLQISAAIFNSTGRPPVKRSSKRGSNRVMVKRKRRAKKRSSDEGSGGDGDGGDNGFGGFGGGGRGWNNEGFGGRDWEYSPDWFSDVLFWIVISGCVHFAFWRVVRIVADGIRGSVPEKGRLCAE